MTFVFLGVLIYVFGFACGAILGAAVERNWREKLRGVRR